MSRRWLVVGLLTLMLGVTWLALQLAGPGPEPLDCPVRTTQLGDVKYGMPNCE